MIENLWECYIIYYVITDYCVKILHYSDKLSRLLLIFKKYQTTDVWNKVCAFSPTCLV